MQETSDTELLRQYLDEHREEAFAALVSRHISLVYSAALRKTGHPQAAEEVVQAVFILLAKKAQGLRHRAVLSGWLYQTARFAAASFLRTEIRRGRREEEACMQSLSHETEPDVWPQIQPLLEDAMGRLGEKERDAIVLRFFEGKSFQEIGVAIGASENAAKKRVSHGLDKLRKFFSKRGVVSTTALIAGAMAAHSVQAAPVALVRSVSAVATAKGSIATASTLTLVKGTMKLMTWLKIKTAVAIGAAVVLATGTTIVATKVVAQAVNDSSSVDDSAWSRMDSRVLATLPSAFVLRPTHFASGGGGGGSGGGGGGVSGGVFGGGMVKAGNKMLGRAVPFDMLMSMAYGVDLTFVVFPQDKPSGLYDLLMTTPDASPELLQAKIKQQLGYAAHRETRQTDVLLLVMKQPNAPGLRPSQGRSGGGRVGGSVTASSSSGSSSISGVSLGGGKKSITSQNLPISNLAKNLQGYFDKPILDQTGLTGNYDVSLEVASNTDRAAEMDAIASALPAQLGLELVPSRQALELLVVEKAK